MTTVLSDPRYVSLRSRIPTDARCMRDLYRFFAEADPDVSASLKVVGSIPLVAAKKRRKLDHRRIIKHVTKKYHKLLKRLS